MHAHCCRSVSVYACVVGVFIKQSFLIVIFSHFDLIFTTIVLDNRGVPTRGCAQALRGGLHDQLMFFVCFCSVCLLLLSIVGVCNCKFVFVCVFLLLLLGIKGNWEGVITSYSNNYYCFRKKVTDRYKKCVYVRMCICNQLFCLYVYVQQKTDGRNVCSST